MTQIIIQNHRAEIRSGEANLAINLEDKVSQLRNILKGKISVLEQKRNTQEVAIEDISIESNTWNEVLDNVRGLNQEDLKNIFENLAEELYSDPRSDLISVSHLDAYNLANGLFAKLSEDLNFPLPNESRITEEVIDRREEPVTIIRSRRTNNARALAGIIEPTKSPRVLAGKAKDPIKGMSKIDFSGYNWKAFFLKDNGYDQLVEVISEIQGQKEFENIMNKEMKLAGTNQFRALLANKLSYRFAPKTKRIKEEKILLTQEETIKKKIRSKIKNLISPITKKINWNLDADKVALAIISKLGLSRDLSGKVIEV